MSTTTAADLLEQAGRLTALLRGHEQAATREQWASFDITVHRLLAEILGPDATYVPNHDPSRAALRQALANYPSPLYSTAMSSPGFEAVKAAAENRVKTQRRLHIAGPDDEWRTSQSQAHPASPKDPHPLARLACTYGALADLLHTPLDQREDLLPDRGDHAALACRILATTAVAARWALLHGQLVDGDRPFAVGQYAEQALNHIGDATGRLLGLDTLGAVGQRWTRPATPEAALEHAIAAWTAATGREVVSRDPSADTLKHLIGQGIHLYTVRAYLAKYQTGSVPAAIPSALRALRAVENAWPDGATTLSQVQHAYVHASRELYESLRAVQQDIATGEPHIDPDRVDATLRRASHSLSNRLAEAKSLPHRLLASRRLFTPVPDPEVPINPLRRWQRPKHRVIEPKELNPFLDAWADAVVAVRDSHLQLLPAAKTAIGPVPALDGPSLI